MYFTSRRNLSFGPAFASLSVLRDKTMKNFKRSTLLPLLLASTLFSACGPQAFVPGTNRLSQTAGDMNLPPKVDILLGIDVKGAMKDIYPGMNSEIDQFAAGLQNSGWDYRFTAISLSEGDPLPMNKIAVAKYDGNWDQYGLWISPYPGALPSAQQILSSYFSQITTPSSLFPSSLSSYGNDGHKTGIQNQVTFLNRSDVRANFLRNDALLAIITLSDSRDTSGGTWQYRAMDGQYIWNAPTPDNLPDFASSLLAVKGGRLSQLKYYSLVSKYQHQGTCRGAYTFAGTRYEQMASYLGGQSIDICANTLPSALNQVSANLNQAKVSFRKVYLVLGTEPKVGSIRITKNGAPVAQSNTNGWEYVGYVGTPTPTIDQPVPMNNAVGYFIRLNGSAMLMGNDVANIEYENLGATSSH